MLFPIVAVALTVGVLLLLRSRPVAVRIATETVLLAAIAVLLVSRGTSPLPASGTLESTPDGPWLRALAVIWWLLGARIVATVVALLLGRDAHSRQARLFSDLVAGAIHLTVAIIILNSVLDLPIKGLVATSGVIAIVLGLALQNTLADLFSGIAVGVEQPIRVGDNVTIGDTDEGLVVEMNWRAVHLQTDAGDLSTIPNSVVAKSRILNRSRPTTRRRLSEDIHIRTTAPTARIVELAGQAAMLSPAASMDPAPAVTLRALGPGRLTISIAYTVADSTMAGRARDQLLRQMRRVLRHAAIETGSVFDRTALVAENALFAPLSAPQRADVLRALGARRLSAGDVVFAEGDDGRSIFIIEDGVFEVGRGGASLGRLGPGEYIGEVSAMNGDRRKATVTALTSGVVLELPSETIHTLVQADPEMGRLLAEALRAGLSRIERDEAARAIHPVIDEMTVFGAIRRFLFPLKGHGAGR